MKTSAVKSVIAGAFAASLVLAPLAATSVLVSADAAYANNAKGGGAGGNSKGGGKGGGGKGGGSDKDKDKDKGKDKGKGGDNAAGAKAKGQGKGLMRLLFGEPPSSEPAKSQTGTASSRNPGRTAPAATKSVHVSAEPTEFAPTKSIRPPKRGRYAPKLHALNAVNSPVSAFLSAAEDSRIGKIRLYYEARSAFESESAARQAGLDAYEEALVYGTEDSILDGRSSMELQDEINAEAATLDGATEEEEEAIIARIAELEAQKSVAQSRETYSDEELAELIFELREAETEAAEAVENRLAEAAAPHDPPAKGSPEREYFDLLLDNKDWPGDGGKIGAEEGPDGLDDA